jgi:hypothetical protein
VALVRTDVSEEPGASFIRVTKIGELAQNREFPKKKKTVGFEKVFYVRSN